MIPPALSFILIYLLNMSTATKETGVAARLARKNILELSPYRCARDDYSDGVLLDANENAYGPAASENTHTLERYPDPYQVPLKNKLCAYRGNGLKAENVFVGVGSDEAIDLLMRIFCRPGHDKILTTPPTYGMYKVCAKVNDVEIVNVPLTPDFDLRIPDVSNPVQEKGILLNMSFFSNEKVVRLTFLSCCFADLGRRYARSQASLSL